MSKIAKNAFQTVIRSDSLSDYFNLNVIKRRIVASKYVEFRCILIVNMVAVESLMSHSTMMFPPDETNPLYC
jgi:hypothetical protein